MGIHNCSCFFLKREAQDFVEVFADGGIGLEGVLEHDVGGLVVGAFPLGEGDND